MGGGHDARAGAGGGHLEFEDGDAGELHLRQQRETAAGLHADDTPEVEGVANAHVGGVPPAPPPADAAHEPVE